MARTTNSLMARKHICTLPTLSHAVSRFWKRITMNSTVPAAPEDRPTLDVAATLEPEVHPPSQLAAASAMTNETKAPASRMCAACHTEYSHDSSSLVAACLGCKKPYCTDCLHTMFAAATTDPTRMPPRCCQFLQLHTAIDTLTDDEVVRYRSKFEEHMTRDKLYCPRPDCSAFISPLTFSALVTGDPMDPPTASCPKCLTQICVACKRPAHHGVCDTKDADDEKAMLASYGYKPCPCCHRAIMKMFGCDHMMCLCGAHFCWACLQPSQVCGGCGEGEDEDEDECDSDEDDESESSEDDDCEAVSEAPVNEADVKEAEGESGDSAIDHGGKPDAVSPASADAESSHLAASSDLARPDSGYGTAPPVVITPDGADSDQIMATLPSLTSEPDATLPTQPTPRVRRIHNHDAGGNRRWEGDEGVDFGPEPVEQYITLLWECQHFFNLFHQPIGDGPNYGNLDRMECNRCFTRVVPAPPREKKVTRKRNSETKSAVQTAQRSEMEGESSDNPGKQQAWWCEDECGLIVCPDCKDLVTLSRS